MIPQTKLPLIDEFISSKRSPGTQGEYRRDLDRFSAYLNGIEVKDCTYLSLSTYQSILQSKGLATGTVNRAIAVLKSYFEFLCIAGYLERNPAHAIKLRANNAFVPTEGLSNEEVCAILGAIPDTGIGRMHRAVLATLLYLGLRRSELCAIKVDDISPVESGYALNILGKGEKLRTLPIPKPLQEIIRAYLSKRVCLPGEPLFTSSKGGMNSLHVNTIRQILHNYATLAGITKKISPHSCRVTAISNALENGANPVYVQAMGGWASMNMVLLYDRRRLELKNSAVYKINYETKK